jgi:hypothetical protein
MSIIAKDDIDVATVEITSYDSETLEMEVKAKEVATMLCQKYPNHPWAVGWAPGAVLVVKHLGGDARYGFTIDAATIATSSELAHMATMAGGELLERMGLPRAPWQGEFGQQYQQ